ncbi:MAG TPA: SDR family NAD(P)-dependent oxidoreductase [Hyphomicrobiaceae bacterium]|jgi:NAD(P)-dependent dehydrogenase (short-subunit alcohol dehydrogenase family)|nr:SDR family NAD(P)-dependent oxidoreductase [Hyphomicrobiaceae bacterium]
MLGKTCVITGATSGIGRAAAEALAAMGARVVMIARDAQRGEAMLASLRRRFPQARHSIHYADLLRLGEVRQVAADIAAAEPRIDVLLNNAGAMFARREITPDGFERTFALNHIAPFVLTHGLRQSLFAAAPARVINTAGCLNHLATLHLDDLRLEHRYDAFYAYAHAKLCCVMFTRELARRWAGKQITANCLHPGEVATNFGYQSGGLIPLAFAIIHLFGSSPQTGAGRLVRLASAHEYAGVTGRYFYKDKLSRPNPLAEDDENAARLWETTARLAAID